MQSRILLAIVVLGGTLWAQAPVPALEGYDPVLLTEGKETPGKETLTAKHDGFFYQFASEETRSRFQNDPLRYGIQLQGACARMGPPVSGQPDTYYVYQSRIYILGSRECYKKFVAAPERFLNEPAPPQGFTDVMRTRGQKALAAVAEVMGGDKRLAEVRSVVETRLTPGQQQNTQLRMARLPDVHRTITRSGQMEYGNLVTSAGAMQVAGSEGKLVSPTFMKAMRAAYARDLWQVMLSRRSKDFAAYETAPGVLEVINEGAWLTLRIDAKTGLVQSATYPGRGGPDMAWGMLRVDYSDYRETAGLKLPFQADVTFDGQMDSARGWKVISYEFNPADIEARLNLPKTVRE